jgi:MFS family permease
MKEGMWRFDNIQKAYIVTFFATLYFIAPILVLFYQENLLSYTQIFMLQSWFTFLIVVLEVPSGALADLFKRRTVLIFSLLCYVLGFGIYSLSYSFLGFLIAETLWATSSAFRSGTGEAFIYDSLKELNREDEAKQTYANLQAISLISVAISSLVGAFFANFFGLRSVFFLSLCAALVAWFLQLSYKEPVHERKEFSLTNFADQIKESIKITFVSKSLSALMFNSAIIAGILIAVAWYYQPHMKASGIPLPIFGTIYACIYVGSALLVKKVPHIESYVGPSKTLFVFDIGAVIAVFCFSFLFNPVVSVLCIFAIGTVRSIRNALFNDYLNRFISSDKRATVLSLNHFFISLVFTILGPISGFISDRFTFSHTLFGLGILLLISVMMLRIGEGVIE